MEIFCTKKTDNDATLEYKMCQSKSDAAAIGTRSAYGFKVKYISPIEFSYYFAEDVAAKPQTVLQLIKYLFDNNIKPHEVYARMEEFLAN